MNDMTYLSLLIGMWAIVLGFELIHINSTLKDIRDLLNKKL